MIEIKISKPGIWVCIPKDMSDWLERLPFRNWEWHKNGYKIIFYDESDALAFRLRFGL